MTKRSALENLRTQVRLLGRRCRDFDDEHSTRLYDEALPIATQLRVIFHHKNNSKSLMNQLGWDEDIEMCSNCEYYSEYNLLPHIGLCNIDAQEKYDLVPDLRLPAIDYGPGRNTVALPLQEWWSEEWVIAVDGDSFTRKDLVLTLTDKDGGAHFDKNISEKWQRLTQDQGVKWIINLGNRQLPVLNAAQVTIRAIAHEAIFSLYYHSNGNGHKLDSPYVVNLMQEALKKHL